MQTIKTVEDDPTMTITSRYKKLLRRYLRLTKRAKKVVHPAIEPEDVLAIERQANVESEMIVFMDVYEISDKQHRKLINAIKLP